MAEPNWDKIEARKQQQILFSKACGKCLAEYSLETISKQPDDFLENIRGVFNLLKEAHAEAFKE